MLDTIEYDPHSPKSIDEIVGNTSIWKELAIQIRKEKAPHLLLCGPAGCGKSLFLRYVMGSRPVLRIDCTANAGLRDARDTIRAFAKGGCTSTSQFRWIILEHADALHADTQAFLRRMLETTSAHSRFLLEVRDIGAITEPLVSRTTLVHIRAPEETEVIYELLRRTDFKIEKDKLKQIAIESHQNIRAAVLEALVLRNCSPTVPIGHAWKLIETYISKIPAVTASYDEWLGWAISTEASARQEGIDLRDILLCKWAFHPIVSQTLSQWSRLGGMSCRALFFSAIYGILRAERESK